MIGSHTQMADGFASIQAFQARAFDGPDGPTTALIAPKYFMILARSAMTKRRFRRWRAKFLARMKAIQKRDDYD